MKACQGSEKELIGFAWQKKERKNVDSNADIAMPKSAFYRRQKQKKHP
jgi:hypothetical protein